ncbi:MAG: tripartite tricarboxylate transporter TctB family protein [Actinomycetota bacterium]|nr:tripartite tricarboxylate transporter TctB family protein [Actinomycetota bacterium]
MRISLKRRVGEVVFAGLTLALGIYALIGALGIRVPESVRVGPTVFPILVSVILMVSASVVLLGVLRGRTGEAEEGEDVDPEARTDWATVAKLVALFVAHLLLVGVIGWALAAALLFGGAAWSLGAKRWWVALLVGLGVGAAIQFLFGTLLGLSLPLGPVLGWIVSIF